MPDKYLVDCNDYYFPVQNGTGYIRIQKLFFGIPCIRRVVPDSYALYLNFHYGLACMSQKTTL